MIEVLGWIGLILLCVGGIAFLLGLLLALPVMVLDFDWEDAMGGLMLSGLVLLILGIVLCTPEVIRSSSQKREEFMAACLKDRKEYECTAMWRSGDSSTVIVPMPIAR